MSQLIISQEKGLFCFLLVLGELAFTHFCFTNDLICFQDMTE